MSKVLYATLLAGFGAQLVKLLLLIIKNHQLTTHDLFLTGGMPSSHSAFVVSLATSTYLNDGLSTTFAIALVFAFVVLRDAYGVRRSVGEEGKQIEKLLKLNRVKSKFHYVMGHTPKQVLAGSVFGFVVSILFFLF